MIQKLPVKNFAWVASERVDFLNQNLDNLADIFKV